MAEEKNNQAPAAETASAPAPEITIPAALPEGKKFLWGIGRRKKATARVRIMPGSGKFTVNKREAVEFFVNERDRNQIMVPLATAKMVKSWDVLATVNGGGNTGQAGAVTLGLARALSKAMPEVEGLLRDAGLLTRDARMKERKKYGQKGARKRSQFSKR